MGQYRSNSSSSVSALSFMPDCNTRRLARRRSGLLRLCRARPHRRVCRARRRRSCRGLRLDGGPAVLIGGAEESDGRNELLGLAGQLLGGGGRLFGGRSVLLDDLFELLERLVDLFGSGVLLAAGGLISCTSSAVF